MRWRPRADGPGSPPSRRRSSGCVGGRSGRRPSWPRPRPRWMSWEKRTRSWNCSPRARTPTRGRRGDRRRVRRARAAGAHPAGVPAAGPVAGHRLPPSPTRQPPAARRPTPPNALSDVERRRLLAVLHEPRFVDEAPAQVWATLLDEGVYLASISTMYRLLRECGETRERRRQATHPARVKPELVARAPNQVWTWDITKLKGPDRGVYYDLLVMLDIFSRYALGWAVAPAESGQLAEAFIADVIAAPGVAPKARHADRGTSMTSKPVAQLLIDLGVARSHSRPHVSNDNPF